ncbi:MAG: S16 family serine protease [Rhodoglobus sp.]
MALFTDTAPERDRPRRGRVIGWLVLAFALVGVTVIALLPAPFVVEEPGPVYNTLGTQESGGKDVPLISIPGQKTYPTDGTLDMLTVRIAGNREDLPSWVEIAGAYLDPSRAVLPIDEIYPVGETVQQSDEQGRIDMQNSQKEAIAAALTDLGYTFPSTLNVVETQKGGPADGVLLPGDIITSVDGQTFADVSALRAGIKANGTDAPATVVVQRDGAEKTLEITPVLSDGDAPVPIIGIIVGSDYTFPFDVKIQLENVGGPSAGMMFALGIIDKLTPGELNGGEDVAGTGTITGAGVVGAIGGIRQKMYGARDAGATWFLAPASNCDEVTGHIPAGLTVFAVKTLDDSLAALKVIAAGGDTSKLPTCPTS